MAWKVLVPGCRPPLRGSGPGANLQAHHPALAPRSSWQGIRGARRRDSFRQARRPGYARAGAELGQLRDAQWQADVQNEIEAWPGLHAGATRRRGQGGGCGHFLWCGFPGYSYARMRNFPLRRPSYPQKDDGASTRVSTTHTPEAAW